MNQSNNNVDVLAVMRRHARAERERLGTTDNDAQAALAAVAELIAATRDAESILRHVTAHDYNRRWFRDETATKLGTLRAALARVGGAA